MIDAAGRCSLPPEGLGVAVPGPWAPTQARYPTLLGPTPPPGLVASSSSTSRAPPAWEEIPKRANELGQAFFGAAWPARVVGWRRARVLRRAGGAPVLISAASATAAARAAPGLSPCPCLANGATATARGTLSTRGQPRRCGPGRVPLRSLRRGKAPLVATVVQASTAALTTPTRPRLGSAGPAAFPRLTAAPPWTPICRDASSTRGHRSTAGPARGAVDQPRRTRRRGAGTLAGTRRSPSARFLRTESCGSRFGACGEAASRAQLGA